MKTNYIVSAIVILVVILIGAGIYSVYKNRRSDTLDTSPLPIPSSLEGFNASPSATPVVLAPDSQPAAGASDRQKTPELTIIEPQIGEILTFPFVVRGYQFKASGNVDVAIYDDYGYKLVATKVVCNPTLDADTCQFYKLFDIEKPQTKSGSIEIISGPYADKISVNFH